jgi:acetylornithine/succinyldiaminopimelate/putrescine aminotransferase
MTISTSEDRYAVPSYARLPVAFVRGRGCQLWDADGNRYLDLYGGHCTSTIGHAHPTWVKALTGQAARLGFVSNIAGNDVRAKYQQRLIDFTPQQIVRVFLCNTGAEANETAVKLAMKATGRSQVDRHGGRLSRPYRGRPLTHPPWRLPASVPGAGAADDGGTFRRSREPEGSPRRRPDPEHGRDPCRC